MMWNIPDRTGALEAELAEAQARNAELTKQLHEAKHRGDELHEIAVLLMTYAVTKREADPCVWCGWKGRTMKTHAPSCPITKAAAVLNAGAEGENHEHE